MISIKNIMLFIIFSLCTVCTIFSMENSSIEGTLVLKPHENLMYVSFVQQDSYYKKLSLNNMQANDPLVSIHVFQDDGKSLKKLYLPGFKAFPELLPLSILMGKKNGDKIIFRYNNETNIILTCNQKIAIESDSFENRLSYLLDIFKQEPNYHLFDKKQLVQAGIIVKIGKGKYQHGPNGYKFSDI